MVNGNKMIMRRGYAIVPGFSIVLFGYFSIYLDVPISLLLALIFAIFGNLALYYNDNNDAKKASLFTFLPGAIVISMLYWHLGEKAMPEILVPSFLLLIGASFFAYLFVKHHV